LARLSSDFLQAELHLGQLGIFNATTSNVDYHHLLVAAHGMDGSKPHTMSLINMVEGMSLAFDYAVVSQNPPAG